MRPNSPTTCVIMLDTSHGSGAAVGSRLGECQSHWESEPKLKTQHVDKFKWLSNLCGCWWPTNCRSAGARRGPRTPRRPLKKKHPATTAICPILLSRIAMPHQKCRSCFSFCLSDTSRPVAAVSPLACSGLSRRSTAPAARCPMVSPDDGRSRHCAFSGGPLRARTR